MEFFRSAHRLSPYLGLVLCQIGLGIALAYSILHAIRPQEGWAELKRMAREGFN
ncbi:MAG: hypothetical protein ABSG51_16850 [Terracidiphilus sp.]|jgi:hypothetical protein